MPTTTKRLSRISPGEMGTLDAQLYVQFERFAERAPSEDAGSITSGGFLRFVRETGLVEHAAISAGEASLAFASVVLGSRKTLRFERFAEACRKLATAKSVTFQALVQLAAGFDPVVETVTEEQAAREPTAGGGFAASQEQRDAVEEAAAAAARTGEAELGFSADHAKSVVAEGSVAALMAKHKKNASAGGGKLPKGKQVSAKVASRQRKFGGGATIFDGDLKGTSSANAKLLAMRTGSVKQRANKFGGNGDGKAANHAASAAKEIRSGAVGARAARFGGGSPAAQAGHSGGDGGGPDAMSASNAAATIGGGAVSKRRDMFGAKHSKGASADFSAAHARAAISSGSVANRAAAFGGGSPAAAAAAADGGGAAGAAGGSAFSPANAAAEIAASGRGVTARLAKFDGATPAEAAAAAAVSSLDAKELTAALRARLLCFYKAHNPENIDKLEGVVAKYVGDGSDPAKGQRKLDKQLKHKYGISLSDFEAAQAQKAGLAKDNPFSKENYVASSGGGGGGDDGTLAEEEEEGEEETEAAPEEAGGAPAEAE
jgi:hypothetical protein